MLYLQSLNWRNMKGKDTGMDDSLCLRELSEGSYEAFDTLYMRYSPIVEQFALSLLKRKEEADDITQNIFLKIWENRSSMSGVHSFRAYLFKMVRNAVYDTFSRRKPTSGLQDSMKLGDMIKREGVRVDAQLSRQLLMNIFYPKAPLHDGAVILSQGRILAAACILPLAVAKGQSFGTRHRAALGITEETDAAVVVVSEERGEISLAMRGELSRNLDGARLRQVLNDLL